MGTKFGAVWLYACGAALAPAAAHASAWAPPTGGQSIWTTVEGSRIDEAFTDTEVYVEAPLTKRISLVVAPRLEVGRTLDPNDPSISARVWRGEAVVGAKALVRKTKHAAVSVQLSALVNRSPADPCKQWGEEARVLGGLSTKYIFAEAEGAYRTRAGGCHGEKLDLTLGWHPMHRWLGMGQAFLDQERGGGVAVTTQVSLVRFTKAGSGLQLGVRFRVDGDNQSERAFVIGWWDKDRGAPKG